MKIEEDVWKLLDKYVQDCIKIGQALEKIDKLSPLKVDRNLKELYSWTAAETLCEVLEADSCNLWNRIIERCPNLGEITDCHSIESNAIKEETT